MTFGAIYGFGFFGSFLIYVLVNCMLHEEYVMLYNLISVLGYCMTPVLPLAVLNIFMTLKNWYGVSIAVVCALLASFLVVRFLGSVS